MLLLYWDTNIYQYAIPTKKRYIPISHIEAENPCSDQRVHEETNQKIVDHTSDFILTESDIARKYLLREELPSDRITKTGSPIFQGLNANKQRLDNSYVLNKPSLEKESHF